MSERRETVQPGEGAAQPPKGWLGYLATMMRGLGAAVFGVGLAGFSLDDSKIRTVGIVALGVGLVLYHGAKWIRRSAKSRLGRTFSFWYVAVWCAGCTFVAVHALIAARLRPPLEHASFFLPRGDAR